MVQELGNYVSHDTSFCNRPLLVNDSYWSTKKMKPKTYQVLSMAVEEGVRYGISRAHKHSDNPTEEYLTIAVTDQVLNSICEWFDLEDETINP